jgi:hypoxanthine phosphoribosyltransferase
MPEVLVKEAPVETLGPTLDRSGAGKPLLSSTRIARRVRKLGREISAMYADIDTPLVIVVILKGATVFAADLLRSLSIPAELDFVRASSYPTGTSSNGQLKLAHMVEGPLVGRHVLLVEDIIDSGVTINAIIKRIQRMGPASLRLASLLDRPARRREEVKIDFCGFVIPDRFVIGYGLDYAGLYRELPHIYSLS